MTRNISDEMTRLEMLRLVLGSNGRAGDARVELSTKDIDDAALIRISDDECLAVASDFVRGSGFYLFQMGLLNYFDIGYYLIVANVSDIAAMGARPFVVLTVVRYSDEIGDEEFVQVFQGIRAAADAVGVEVIGGDIGGYSADVFAATALGTVPSGKALLRRNAQVGDLVCVTGTIGLAITALTYFKEVKPKGLTLSSTEEERLLRSWKRPVAHIREGLLLSEHGLANAAQDISDGLKATIEQMSAVAHKGFTIHAEKLPIDDATKRVAEFVGVDPVQIAVSASVDFELMFTIPRDRFTRCADLFEENSVECIVIGEVNADGVNVIVHSDGKRSEIPGLAWKQQGDGYLKAIVGSGRSP